jgi:hypothetical protein
MGITAAIMQKCSGHDHGMNNRHFEVGPLLTQPDAAG